MLFWNLVLTVSIHDKCVSIYEKLSELHFNVYLFSNFDIVFAPSLHDCRTTIGLIPSQIEAQDNRQEKIRGGGIWRQIYIKWSHCIKPAILHYKKLSVKTTEVNYKTWGMDSYLSHCFHSCQSLPTCGSDVHLSLARNVPVMQEIGKKIVPVTKGGPKNKVISLLWIRGRSWLVNRAV